MTAASKKPPPSSAFPMTIKRPWSRGNGTARSFDLGCRMGVEWATLGVESQIVSMEEMADG